MKTSRIMLRTREAGIMHLVRMRNLFESIEWPASGLEVIIKLARRTNPQNAHYWSVVIPMVADHMTEHFEVPITTTTAHAEMKRFFLPESFRTYSPKDGAVTDYGSTTDLTRSGDGDDSWPTYIVKIQSWAAKSGLQIPDPNEEAQ